MATQRTLGSSSRCIPPYYRFVEAASGENPWTAAELAIRNSSPRWLWLEAQAHVELCDLEASTAQRCAELKRAAGLVVLMPTKELRDALIELLLAYLPEPADQSFLTEAIRRASKPRLDSRIRKTAIAIGSALAALAVLVLIAVFLSDRSQSIEVTSRFGLTGAGGTKDVGGVFYAGDILDYQSTVRTRQRHVFLVSIDNERAFIRDYAMNHDSSVGMADEAILDARNCFEFYVIIAADEALLPMPSMSADDPTEVPWLSAISRTIQDLGQHDVSSQDRVEAEILQAIRHEGFAGKVEIHVDRVTHWSTKRPHAK